MGLLPSTCPWLTQDSDYVVAVRNFLPEDPALLAFHKGDIIHLQPLEPPRVGQCHWGGLGAGGGGWPRRPPWQMLTQPGPQATVPAAWFARRWYTWRSCDVEVPTLVGAPEPGTPYRVHPSFTHSCCRCTVRVSWCPKVVWAGQVS